jgi:curved DNA-binding protein
MANGSPDYYALLGISKTASQDEVKAAYRRMARKHHPDLHPEKEKARAAETFKAVNQAYEVLSDPEKRARYDRFGSAEEPRPGPARENPSRRARRPSPETGGDGAFGGFGDFFENLYGAQDRASAGRGVRDVEAEMEISLEDAVRGGEKTLTVKLPVACPVCGGAGRRGRIPCPNCGGTGEVLREKTITARLPQAVRDGMKLRLRGQGASAGGVAGDLFLRLRLLPHPSFKVAGSDLETTVTVMPWTAALGGEARVAALEGVVRIKVPAGTRAGRTFRVAGKGLGKDGGGRGDLLAAVVIDLPEKIDARAEKLYRELGEASE